MLVFLVSRLIPNPFVFLEGQHGCIAETPEQLCPVDLSEQLTYVGHVRGIKPLRTDETDHVFMTHRGVGATIAFLGGAARCEPSPLAIRCNGCRRSGELLGDWPWTQTVLGGYESGAHRRACLGCEGG
jgi:hypothetical protein